MPNTLVWGVANARVTVNFHTKGPNEESFLFSCASAAQHKLINHKKG